MATSIESHVVDITTCAICLEKLNIPKYLPCLHTFCESCLRTYITAIFEKEHKQSIECPVCRTSVTLPKEARTPDEWAKVLPLNFLIVGLLEKEKVESPQKQCMVCERMETKSEASFICVDCSDLLCSNCKKHHKASKTSCDHEIRQINELSSVTDCLKTFKNKCSEHKGEELKLFCADNQTPCCSMCVSIHHRRCEHVLSIEDAAMEYSKSDKIEYLRTQLGNVNSDVKAIIKDRSSAKENIEKEYYQKQKDLEIIFCDLVAKINDLKVRREAELLKNYNEAKEAIETTIIIFQNKQKNIENEKQILDAAVNIASNVQVMIEVEKLKKHVEEHKQLIQTKITEIVNYELVLQNAENITKLAEQMEKECQISCKKTNKCIELSSVTVTPNFSEIFSCCRFGKVFYGWKVGSSKKDAIRFSLSKEIELCGLLSYVCSDGLSTCDVNATVKHDTTDLVVVTDTIDSKLAENKMVKIEFPTPVKLLANKNYHAVMLMRGPQCYYGENGKTVVDSHGVVFTFEHSPLSDNFTSTGSGQIPGFLFRIPV
ncbi:tripartite motif-containing protein 2-like [Mytilus californianus]|uniref:tripartite motif-containing protein 2-like n=1 Tax=Mytilus californianus TaxID=6549 RepID=UPI00224689FC|nr:tripartite motif-containing protein 2-like [Mytilus californianus]